MPVKKVTAVVLLARYLLTGVMLRHVYFETGIFTTASLALNFIALEILSFSIHQRTLINLNDRILTADILQAHLKNWP